MQSYLIVSPGLIRQHAGTLALARLCDKLKLKGFKAVMNYDVKDVKEYELAEHPITVFPEIFNNNHGAKKCVSWILNDQRVNTPFDIKFYWHKYTGDVPSDRLLSVDIIDHELFNNENCEFRRWNAYYVGKGAPSEEHLGEVNEITFDYPADKKELAMLLKKSVYLYTCDAMTNLISEACLVGTPVVFLENKKYTKETFIKHMSNVGLNGVALSNTQEEKDKAMKSVHLFKKDYADYFGQEDVQVDRFVEVTQNM